jgi:MSHA pilin protein MshD
MRLHLNFYRTRSGRFARINLASSAHPTGPNRTMERAVSLEQVAMIIGRNNRRAHWVRGLTLVEAILALTIFPLAVTGISFAITSGQSEAIETLRQTRAAMLAGGLMEEILSKPYSDPGGASALGPEAGETTRTLFDNADDYHSYSEAAGSLATADGTAYTSEFQVFSRSVTCSYTTVTIASLSVNVSALQIVVTVSDTSGTVVTLTRVMLQP